MIGVASRTKTANEGPDNTIRALFPRSTRWRRRQHPSSLELSYCLGSAGELQPKVKAVFPSQFDSQTAFEFACIDTAVIDVSVASPSSTEVSRRRVGYGNQRGFWKPSKQAASRIGAGQANAVLSCQWGEMVEVRRRPRIASVHSSESER